MPRVSSDPTNPRSPDYDPSAHAAKAQMKGERAGRAEARKEAKETVKTEKAKSHRRGVGEGRAAAQREHKERAQDPAGPMARQARRSYQAGTDDVVAYFKSLNTIALSNVDLGDLGAVRAPINPDDFKVEPAQPRPSEPGVSTVEFGAPQRAPQLGGLPAMNRQNGARIILVLVGASAVAIVVQQHGKSVTTEIGGHKVVVTGALRQYAALVIVGIIALIVNEFSPAVAVGLMLVLGIDIAINTGILEFLTGVVENRGPLTLVGAAGSGGLNISVSGHAQDFPGSGGFLPGTNIPKLTNPTLPWHPGDKEPPPWEGFKGHWIHQHNPAGIAPGDYWVWIPDVG